MTLALTTAFLTAALAVIVKIIQDAWARFDQRRGVAGAIAGEVRAYIDILEPSTFKNSLYRWTLMSPEDRKTILGAITPLPNEHLVFHTVADKLVLLPSAQVVGISRFYTAATGVRLAYMHMQSPDFISQRVDEQNLYFAAAGDLFSSEYQKAADELLPKLNSLAEDTVPKYIWRKMAAVRCQCERWLSR